MNSVHSPSVPHGCYGHKREWCLLTHERLGVCWERYNKVTLLPTSHHMQCTCMDFVVIHENTVLCMVPADQNDLLSCMGLSSQYFHSTCCIATMLSLLHLGTQLCIFQHVNTTTYTSIEKAKWIATISGERLY